MDTLKYFPPTAEVLGTEELYLLCQSNKTERIVYYGDEVDF